ncbi:MAG TPA: cyclic pyranopterin monophosphate synthase MoaC [Candidatus Dormibacteraeota bacterium]|nr:cyclic pyranopterin monophosphate synthase MoaC [Candidatus Dormibacteraeota bacterium]
MSEARLSHLSQSGEAKMVDVSDKPVTRREARAMARVRMSAQALAAVSASNLPKGEALGPARVAGIQAAKRCSELIPMCHPLPLTYVDVECRIVEEKGWIEILSTVRCEARTGAEMEALTAAAVAALTVVDMAKSADPWMTIDGLQLLEKSGGKSGSLKRPVS